MIELGFIGCGGINCHHARAIRGEVEGISIAAGADISADARDRFGKENPGAVLYDDYGAMLDQADIAAVCIGLPTSLHAEATIAAAEAGKHIFCEKPMTMKLSDADRMIGACAEAGVKFMIGHVRRYDPDWGTFRSIIESGAIGRPVLWRQTAGGAGPAAPWYMNAGMGGGPFMDGAVHNWDFANWIFGKPAEAMGSIMRFRRDSTALDTGSAIVRYESGDEVLLSWSWALPKGCRAGGAMEALGPQGVVKFPGAFSTEGLGEYDAQKCGAYLLDTGDKKELVTFEKANMFAEEWKDFRDAIEDDRDARSTGATAKQAVAVALAVLESGKTRKPVEVKT